MGDNYEVSSLSPESRTVKVQSKYVSRNQLEKISKKRDFVKKIQKIAEKKLEKNPSYKNFGKYQSEGEEGGDRAHISQLLVLFT